MTQTYRLLIDGKLVKTGLTARECDALVRTARKHPTQPWTRFSDSGCRIDTQKERPR